MVVPPTLPTSGQQLAVDGSGPGPDQCRDGAWIGHRLDGVSGVVAPQLAAKFHRREHAAEHRRHPVLAADNSGRHRAPRAVSRHPANRADQRLDPSPHARRDSCATRPGLASMCGWTRRRWPRPRPIRWQPRSARRCCSCTTVPPTAGPSAGFMRRRCGDDAVASADIASIQSYQTRWTLRRAQGHADPGHRASPTPAMALNDGAWHLLAQGVAWHLGALAIWRGGELRQPAGRHLHPWRGHLSRSGPGVYRLVPERSGRRQRSVHLAFRRRRAARCRPGFNSDTAPEDAADIAAIIWPWSENDSCRQYSEKATYEAAARRLLSLERGMLSRPRRTCRSLVVGDSIPLQQQRSRHANAARGRGRHGRPIRRRT